MKFDSFHPFINLMYFFGAMAAAIAFNHPFFVGAAYICFFAYSVKLNKIRGLIFDLCLIPLILFYAGFYSYYNHFGLTPLRQNFIGNSITMEALVYGLILGLIIASIIMWMSCLFAIFSADKVVYLFGRISPKLSLFLSILLRSVPRIKERARRINVSQRGIGRGIKDGNPLRRFINILRLLSILITWTLENFVESAKSMKCRGYSLKGRTAFSIYRFDNRDRGFVMAVTVCMTLTAMAVMLDQTDIYYDPEIIMNRITFMSYIFYAAYGALLLLPLVLQIVGEWRFKRLARD